MEAFIISLLEQLEIDLNLIDPDESPVRGYGDKIGLVEKSILKIKTYLSAHPFSDVATEVRYFKEWAPSFFKQQILFTLLYNLERTRISAKEKEDVITYLKKKRNDINRFFGKQKKLRIYYRLGSDEKDMKYFIRKPPSKKKKFLIADQFFCNNSINLGKIMAFEEFLTILEKELSDAEGVTTECQWMPTKAQTAEIIYAFVRQGCIFVNGHAATIKDVVKIFQGAFGLKTINIYDVEFHNKKRKKDKAPFLRTLLDASSPPEE